MAKESVIYLKVESKFYDDKLKRAVQGMQHFEQQCEATGKSLADADKKTLDYINALGDMGTVATSATGKLNELTKAYTELSVQYQKMSAAEKKSAPGQALAGSLDKLKGRIGELKGQIDTAKGGLGSMGDAAKQLGGKLGIPTELFTKMGPAVAGAAAALKVAKDAFLQTEGGMDAWGAACESAKASYSVFLNTLNNGNWSGFFTNLKDAITGANKLYDAMDRLSSIKQNNMAAIAKEQATIQELRLRQEKGENVAKELAAAEERLKKLQMESVEQGKVAGAEQMKQTITNSVNSIKGNGGWFGLKKDTTTKVTEQEIDAAIQDILEHGQQAMDKYAAQYKELQTKGTKTITNYSQDGHAYYTKEFDITTLSKEEQGLYKLAKAITDSEGNLAAGIQTYATALQEGASANREARKTESAVKKEQTEVAKPQTQAEEKVKKALEDYASALNIAAIRKEAGLDDDEKYKTNELAAHERLFDAYTDAYNLYKDPKYKEAFDKEAEQILALAQTVKELKDEKERQKEADRELKQAEREAAAQMKQLDNSILGGLTGKAKKAGWNASDLGVDGFKTKINAGIDITEDEWKAVQDRLNERLKSLGLDPIQINFETGNIEEVFDEVKTQMDSLTDRLSSGVGAISTLGNAFNDLKGIGEDLTAAFSGEMDAWDALMTVFNSGIGIMQTVIGVMEAINTLQELSSALSKKKVVEQAAETTAVVSGKGAEMAAETAETAASGAATAANTAEAAAGAGKAMAGIPIVGPVLAIAAIAAVLAAVLAATSKAKSAGKFASGGVVGGNSYSGDRLMAYVNSGETILTPSQADKAMAGIQGNPMQNLQLSTEISGTNLRIVMNNDNRSKGGSRGYYANIH